MVEEASAKYITENSLNLDGYCIMCTANYQELFFKVNECPCPTLEVATKENEASVFHIVKLCGFVWSTKKNPNLEAQRNINLPFLLRMGTIPGLWNPKTTSSPGWQFLAALGCKASFIHSELSPSQNGSRGNKTST